MVITDVPLETARKYQPARVFLVGTPSLALWRAATGTGVVVTDSPAAVAVKLGIQAGPKVQVPQIGVAVQLPESPTIEEPEREQQPGTYTLSTTNEVLGYQDNLLVPIKRATIIAMYNLKASVGKTTVSMNLAAVLRRQGYAVCLVDLDVKTGGATSYLYPNSRPIVDIVSWDEFPLEKSNSWATVETFLATGPAGMFVLPSPETYQSGVVTNQLTGMVLDVLSQHFDFIIVDMAGNTLESRERKALAKADMVLLLATPDTMAISGTTRTIEQAVGPGKPVDLSRIRFIVNRDRPRSQCRPKEIVQEVNKKLQVGLELAFVIPDDSQAIEEAAQNHTLPVLHKKESLFKKSIEDMAVSLVPGFSAVKQSEESFLSRLCRFFTKFFKKGEKYSEKSHAHVG